MQAQRPAGIAARAGLITGLFAGILSLPFITLSRIFRAPGLGLLFLFIALIAFAIAGYLAARRSGLVRSGVGAGALAAFITLFIAFCFGVVIIVLLTPRLALVTQAPLGGGPFGGGRGVPNPGIRPLLRLRSALSALFLGSLLIMGAGVGGGFLGWLLARLTLPRQPATPQFSPGAPVAPQFTPQPYAPASGSNAPTDLNNPSAPPYYPPPPIFDAEAPTTPSGPQE